MTEVEDRPGPTPRVTVLIATCNRPAGLRRLLQSIGEQSTSARLSLVVVDNSGAGSELANAEELAALVGLPTVLLHEPTPGIPMARNRALDWGLPAADYLAFVDDDEVVPPRWIDAMLDGLDRHDADVVTGLVLPIYPAGSSAWLIRTGIFDRRDFPDGTMRHEAATNNTMVRADLFRSTGARFDEQLALTGGSDVELFRRLAADGARIVWLKGIDVFEHLEPDRVRVQWLWRRWYRIGNRQGATRRSTVGLLSLPSLSWVLTGIGRAVLGTAAAAPLAPIRPRKSLTALRYSAIGLGRLAGVLGITFEEYRDRHR